MSAHGNAHAFPHAAASAPADASLAPRARAPGVPGSPAEAGTWSEPVDWPVLAVHAALLPTGDVLAWDATPDDFDDDPHTAENTTTRVTLWNPATDTHRAVWNDGSGDLFCAGSAHLWDGRVLFAGGDSGRSGRNGPLANSNVFDPWTGTWSETDSLNAPRWYSSVAALPDATMLTFGGTYSPTPIGEVFELNARWRPLPVTVPFTVSGDYAWLQSTSDGDVAYLGPDSQLGMLSTEGDGAWSSLGARDADGYRSYGSYALYDVDRVLVAGGGNSLASATLLDLSDGTSAATAPMRHGRRQHDLTILADGQVLASGGNGSGAQFVDLEAGVRAAEIWDPATGTWTDVATAPTERQYHSSTLLLPDGRVLSAGGGYCAPCGDVGYHAQNAEIFTPPYLYEAGGAGTLAERPVVTRAPERIDWSDAFEVSVSNAASIARVHLIKLGSVTHSQNQDQRLVPLEFRRTATGLVVESPANRRIAPPGHYLLFLVDDRGVPSIAPIVQVGQPLLRSGDVVVDAMRTAGPNLYEVEGQGAHALELRLRGDARLLDVSATVRLEDGAVRDAPLSCTLAPGPQRGSVCTATAGADARWVIGIDGPDATAYELLARLRPGAARVTASGFGDAAGASPAPRDVRTTRLTDDTIELTWDAPAGKAPVVGYEIHRDGRLARFQAGDTLRESTLRPATTYAWRVVAVDASGNRSSPSLALVTTTLPYEGPDPDERYHPKVPSAPTGVRTVAYSDTTAEVFWEPSYDDGHVVGYEVYRDGELVATLDATSWYDGNLVPGVEHAYVVVAIDDDGQRSEASSEDDGHDGHDGHDGYDGYDGYDGDGDGYGYGYGGSPVGEPVSPGGTGQGPARGPGTDPGAGDGVSDGVTEDPAAPKATAKRSSGGGLVLWMLPALGIASLRRSARTRGESGLH